MKIVKANKMLIFRDVFSPIDCYIFNTFMPELPFAWSFAAKPGDMNDNI